MAIKYIDQIDIQNKRLLIREDYNVPYNEDMEITDDTRIKATLKTLNYSIEKNAIIILISHLGRPKGRVVQGMTLKPVADRLSKLIGRDVKFLGHEINDEIKSSIDRLGPGSIALLENIRFNPGEEKNSDELGEKLASLADIYVNDAFATAHRGHASNEAVTKYIGMSCAGFLLKDEIEYLNRVMHNPERPLCAIIGGAKVSTKLGVLENIISRVDSILIGGGMAFTFYRAMGHSVGKSLMEEELVDAAKNIMEKARKNNVEILLPVDIVVSPEFDNNSESSVVSFDRIPDNLMGLDIGPESVKQFSEKVKNSKTIVWNGPMGAFEMENFSHGTYDIARAVADSHCLSIIGGGDSVSAINKIGLADKVSYISTGGGAFLELLEGKTLPALKALDRY